MNSAGRRPSALLAAAAAAIALHGAIGLVVSDDGPGAGRRVDRWAVPISVRMLSTASGGEADPPPNAPPPRQPPLVPAHSPVRQRVAATTPAAATLRSAPAEPSAPTVEAAAVEKGVGETVPREPSSAVVGATGTTTQVDEPADTPLYPTALPPPALLRYGLRRGESSGSAVLSWEPVPAEGSYRLQLDGWLDGSLLMTQISSGGFDVAGLAPTRFTERRPRSGARAVNFQRERGIVSFSGPSFVHPLQAGMQDRLSWIVQLAGIVAADPQRSPAGAQTQLIVVGPRGDADSWVFVSAGMQSAAGALPAVLLVREPRKPYDLRIEVWLDPSRHHLPSRARLGTWPAGAVLELMLDAESTGAR